MIDKIVMGAVFLSIGGSLAWVLFHYFFVRHCEHCYYPLYKCDCEPLVIYEQNVDRPIGGRDGDLQ